MSDGGGAVGGGVFGAMGSLMESGDKASAYGIQAEQLRRNATLDLQVGQYNVMRQQMSANKTFGAMAADNAASGVAADSGSTLSVLMASHANSELDRLNILHGANVKAQALTDRADMDDRSADQITQAGYINAIGSLFGAGKSINMSDPSGSNGDENLSEDGSSGYRSSVYE